MKRVVEFSEIYGSDFPSISTLTSPTPDADKQKIVKYLKSGKHVAESPSRIVDFITGKPLNIPLSMQTDGCYSWRSDIVYYYEKYNVKLNNDFIRHALSQ